jgi:hypothetical protein
MFSHKLQPLPEKARDFERKNVDHQGEVWTTGEIMSTAPCCCAPLSKKEECDNR